MPVLESLIIKLQVFRRGTPSRVFPREISEIFKNTYFEEHLRMTAYVNKLPRKPCFEKTTN